MRRQFGADPVTGEVHMPDKYTALTECIVDRPTYARQKTKDLKWKSKALRLCSVSVYVIRSFVFSLMGFQPPPRVAPVQWIYKIFKNLHGALIHFIDDNVRSVSRSFFFLRKTRKR